MPFYSTEIGVGNAKNIPQSDIPEREGGGRCVFSWFAGPWHVYLVAFGVFSSDRFIKEIKEKENSGI